MVKRRIIPFALLIIVAGIGLSTVRFSEPATDSPAGRPAIKSKETQVIGAAPDQAITLGSTEKNKTVESQPIKAEFQFNALAPHWKETNATDSGRKFEMRTSMNEKDWGPWLEIEAVGALREDEPHPDRVFAENPILADGQYFQYRISLNRNTLQEPSPQIYDLKVSSIDSRTPVKKVGIIEKIKNSFRSDKAYAAQQHPRVITRSEWGSPDPYGNLFKGTDRYWPPIHKPVKQIFIHHTVTSNFQADPSAAVRAIWDFHANTRGWGDVGYNYLVDGNGNAYQGRLGGDNAVGGHVLDYNRGSLGVALLGCFDGSTTCRQLNGGAVGPSNQLISGLTSLLSNKATGFEIDPWGSNSFCDVNGQNCLNLPTITGHRDANQTSCPGELTVQKLQQIRNDTRAKNIEGWTYSAKQLDYGPVDLSTSVTKSVTLRFKNTGRSTWTNTGSKTSLFNMEPPGTHSIFQGSGWPSAAKPAVLNEASVGPGATGSFTFNMNRPNIPPGRYLEAHTLITDAGSTPGAFFTLPITVSCTIGQASNPRPNGSLIREADTGKAFLIEDGKKRLVTTSLAAVTNGLNLPYAIPVSTAETALLPNAAAIYIKEGTLLKSNTSASVYILDETPSGFVRRSVPGTNVMAAFGMQFSQVQTISQAALSAYTAGPALLASSEIPDGRLAKAGSDPSVYIVEDGKRRLIASSQAFHSYGFQPAHIGTVTAQRINQLPAGTPLNLLRSGTLIKMAGSPTIYVSDIDSGSPERRRISTPYAFAAAGYRTEAIVAVPTGMLGSYVEASSVECYK